MERREELLFIDRTVEPERQVLPQGPIQQPDLLTYDGHPGVERFQREVADVVSIE